MNAHWLWGVFHRDYSFAYRAQYRVHLTAREIAKSKSAVARREAACREKIVPAILEVSRVSESFEIEFCLHA
jgi:hypothetical protein